MENNVTQYQEVDKKTYSVPEVAQILGIGVRSAYDLCQKTGLFRVLHFGRTVRVHKASFDAWFETSS